MYCTIDTSKDTHCHVRSHQAMDLWSEMLQGYHPVDILVRFGSALDMTE